MKPKTASDGPGAPGQSLWTALACAAILAAGIAAWSNSFNGPFIFDDLLAIQDNPTLQHFPSWENFAPQPSSPTARRPIVNLTLAINAAISGRDVRGFHAGNLLIHLLAALTLFGIVRRTLLAPPLRERFGGAASGLAMAVALIWAVHPLLTESVTYLTQRTESLMGLFFLLTLYGAIRGAASAHPWRWYAAAIAACALGMGSKEVMVVAPVVVLLYDRCFLSGSFREALRRRPSFYLGLAATWTVLGALLIAYPWGGTTGAGFGLAPAGPWEYARTQPGVILNYLRLSFWPRPLCLDYGWPIATGARQIMLPAAVIAALLAATLWALRRTPALGFLGAWFFLILAPTSSFVPIVTEVAAERRMYLPLAAIVTGCVVAACRLAGPCIRHAAVSPQAQKRLSRAAAAMALLSVAGVLGWLTFDRNADYRDPILLWRDTVNKRPENARAWNNLGWAYSWTGDSAKAVPYFNKAIELKRDYAEAYNNLGADLYKLKRPAEALEDLNKAIQLNPECANAYCNRAALLLDTRRYDQALADCDKAIELIPAYAQAYNNRGNVFLMTGRASEAIPNYDRAIALLPGYADPYCNRASARCEMKEYDKAYSDLITYMQMGGHPDPLIVEQVRQAAGRMK